MKDIEKILKRKIDWHRTEVERLESALKVFLEAKADELPSFDYEHKTNGNDARAV